MRPLLELLGFSPTSEEASQAAGDPSGDTATVRRIVRELEELPPERARFVAAFAYLLSRVAHADLEISEDETARMEEVVRRRTDLPEDQAVLVVQVAKMQSRLLGHTENFQVAREFRGISTKTERRGLVDCLFAVASADEEISSVEEQEIRRIADELALSHRELVEIRSPYNEKRSIIQSLSGDSTPSADADD